MPFAGTDVGRRGRNGELKRDGGGVGLLKRNNVRVSNVIDRDVEIVLELQ